MVERLVHGLLRLPRTVDMCEVPVSDVQPGHTHNPLEHGLGSRFSPGSATNGNVCPQLIPYPFSVSSLCEIGVSFG